MPGFSDISDDLTSTCFAAVGDEAIFEPASGGTAVPLLVGFEESTSVVGDFGRVVDQRPSIKFPRSAIGVPRGGTIHCLGRTFKLDAPVDGSGDSQVAHFWVKEVANG